MRQGQAGEQIIGTPGDVLTMQPDGTVAPNPLPAPPSSGPAIVLTSNLVPAWQGLVTAIAVDDTFTQLAQFIDGANAKNPFLVNSVDDGMSSGNGADASLFAAGQSRHLLVSCMVAFEVTFSAGVGLAIFTVGLFDNLGNQLAAEGIFVSPTTQLVRLALAADFTLAAPGAVFLKVKKNDDTATIDGCNLLGCSLAAAVLT